VNRLTDGQHTKQSMERIFTGDDGIVVVSAAVVMMMLGDTKHNSE
jgi:hypothetical protein